MYPIQERIHLVRSSDGPTHASLTFPTLPNQGAIGTQAKEITIRGHRGFRLTVVMNNAGSGSLAPSVQEVFFDGTNFGKGRSWAKTADISGNGVFTLTVYPGLTAASGANDVVSDVIGYSLQILLTHKNNNDMKYDAYIDLIP